MSGAEEVGDAWEGAVSTKKAIRKQVQQVDERSGKDSKVTSLPLKLLLHQLANEPRKCTLPMNPNEQEEVLRLFRHLVQMTLFNSRSRPPDSQPKLCRSERLHKLPCFQRPRHGSLRGPPILDFKCNRVSKQPRPDKQFRVFTMFKITQRPPVSALGFDEPPSTHRKHPAELDGMDLDDDLGEGPSSLRRTVVSPGEVITSAKDYMR